MVPECVQAIISTQTRPAQELTFGSAEASSVHLPESSLLSNYRAPGAPGQGQQSQSSQSVIGLSPSEGMHIHSNERNPVDHNISVLGGFQPWTSEAGVSTVWGAPSRGSPLARLRPSNGMGQDMPPSTQITASSNSISSSVPVSSGLRPGITNHLLASLSGNTLDRTGNQDLVATPTPWAQSPAFIGQPLLLVYRVPESIKKKAWLGHNVPLYMFLPGCTTTQLVPTQQADGSFVLTSNQSETERQLSRRVLTPSEFASAFTRYKEVICERFPDCARELDSYLLHILGMVSSYTGKAYWQYHTLFSSKAAGLWARGYKVNFSIVDATILHASIAFERANVCANCQQPLHATAACPFNLQKGSNPGFSKGGKEGNSKFFPLPNPVRPTQLPEPTTEELKYVTTLTIRSASSGNVTMSMYVNFASLVSIP